MVTRGGWVRVFYSDRSGNWSECECGLVGGGQAPKTTGMGSESHWVIG